MGVVTSIALTAALTSAPFAKMQGTYRADLCKKTATSQNTQNFCDYKKLSIGVSKFGMVFYFFNIHSGASPHTAMSFPLRINKNSNQSYQEAGNNMASFVQQDSNPRTGYNNSTTLMKRADGSYMMLYQSESKAFAKKETFEIHLTKTSSKSVPLPTVPDEEDTLPPTEP